MLGLRHLVTKSGADTLTTLKEILEDIDSTSRLSNNTASKKILLNIVSLMSDRAATQMKFNNMLEDYRQDVLKESIGNAWNEMTEAEQLSVSKLNNFFCTLHALVHAAEAASSCLIEAERGLFESSPPIFDPSFRKAN